MRALLRRAFPLLLLTASAVAASAQDPSGDVACRACANHGTLPCKKHARDIERERNELVRCCSEAAACRACAGALAVDCKQCRNDAAERALAERQKLVAAWLEARRKHVDATTGRQPFLHLETTHFDLASGLGPATVGRDKIDPHDRLHLYGERLEALRAEFVRVLELAESDLPSRMRIYMFDEQKDHGVIGPRETGFGNAQSTGLKQMGPEYVYSMWADRRSLPDDEAVHRNLVHNTTHLLLARMPPERWIGNRQHGWIDEGLAHWFEDHVVGKCTNYCYEEVLMLAGAGFKGGKWRPAVRKLVDGGKAVPFAVLAAKNTDQLTHEEHALSFALVDWLVAVHGGAKLRDLVRLVKDGKATREALQSVYGLSPLTVDEPFHAWIVASYSPLDR